MIFTEIKRLDVILERVRGYLPPTLSYLKIRTISIGWEQLETEIFYYDINHKEISIDIIPFTIEEQERFEGEYCLIDYIYNSLIGMTKLGISLPYFDFHINTNYYYKIN